MKTIIGYLRPYFGKMSLGLTIKIFGTLVELFIPYIMSNILATVSKSSITEVILKGALMVLCALSGCLMNIKANRMASKVSRDFAEEMRRDLFKKTLCLSAAQTDKFTVPSLESRITTDTYHVHGFINMMQRMGVRAPILLAGGLAITLFMDAYLSLVMFSMIPLLFVTVYFIRKKGIPLYTKVQSAVDDVIKPTTSITATIM